MATADIRTYIIPEEFAGKRLDQVLAKAWPDLSRTRLKALILAGQLQKDKGIIGDPSHRVKCREHFEIHIPPPEDPIPKPEAIELDVIFEDDQLLVINKPAGLVVHPAPGNPNRTLVNALLAHCGDSLSGISGVKRPGIVHRLDKETSGLMVVAKTNEAHHFLSAQFANRELSRTYQALAWGIPRTLKGTVEGNIGRHPRNRKKMTVLTRSGKSAITHYKTTKKLGQLACLIECKLETGRTHQIRVHLSHIGHPIIGDPLYGKRPQTSPVTKLLLAIDWPKDSQALHVTHLKFIHPTTKEEVAFSCPLPKDMENLLKELSCISDEKKSR